MYTETQKSATVFHTFHFLIIWLQKKSEKVCHSCRLLLVGSQTSRRLLMYFMTILLHYSSLEQSYNIEKNLTKQGKTVKSTDVQHYFWLYKCTRGSLHNLDLVFSIANWRWTLCGPIKSAHVWRKNRSMCNGPLTSCSECKEGCQFHWYHPSTFYLHISSNKVNARVYWTKEKKKNQVTHRIKTDILQ